MISLVVAMDRFRGIGFKGQLPWKLPGDMRFFRELTTCPDRAAVEQKYGLASGTSKTGEPVVLPMYAPDHRNAVLMGRTTWESLPPAFKPLPNRFNGVLSRSGATTGEENTHKTWTSWESAVAALHGDKSVSQIFVIGGAQIYAKALNSSACTCLYVTEIDAVFFCDTFFPEIPSRFQETAASDWIEEGGIRYRFRLLNGS